MNLYPLVLLAYSLAMSALSYAINWALVYRTPRYRKIRAETEEDALAREDLEGRAALTEAQRQSQAYLAKRAEARGLEMAGLRFKAGAASFVVSILGSRMFSRYIGKRAVAVAPFDLPFPLAKYAQRGLPAGHGPRDLAAGPIITLTSQLVRAFTSRLTQRVLAPALPMTKTMGGMMGKLGYQAPDEGAPVRFV